MSTIKTKSFGIAEIHKTRYTNGRLAIKLIDHEDGSNIATITVNLPEVKLAPGEFCVKGWSENREIIEDCRQSGLFIDTGKRIPTGFVQAEIWKETN